MKRILWHGIGPWWPTGYGLQTALFAPRLRDLGYQVVISQMGERPAEAADEYLGVPVIGPGKVEYALPRMEIEAALGGEPDLVIVLKDAWVLNPAQFRRYRTALWAALDTSDRMGHLDLGFFKASGATPVACAMHGQSMMRKAGLDPLYVPSGIETGQWAPGDQVAARELLGLPADHFIAGLNAMNLGGHPSRKAFFEQFAAFAQFRARHPKSLLLAHTAPEHPEGVNLRHIVDALGIADAVLFGSHTRMAHDQMLAWYQCLDVLMMATMGEGVGLPAMEALACGVPVIATDCAGLPERIPAGGGWLVRGQPWWNSHHRACWTTPDIGGIERALRKAFARDGRSRVIGPRFMELYDADYITAEYWKPALETLIGG
jgi:glycosyltransferase involved in cell wall biosynthesis